MTSCTTYAKVCALFLEPSIMIKLRYFAKEVFSAMAAVTVILLLIFLSNQFVRYLGYAAAGAIPGIFVFKLMMLEVGNLIGLLLPMGFFLGVLLAYGRICADSEMTVLSACGMSRLQLLKITLIMAIVVALIDGGFMLWLGPKIAADRDRIIVEARGSSIVETIIPNRFQSMRGGQQVFYVGSINNNRDAAENVFMARFDGSWKIATAERATVATDPQQQSNWVILENGQAYQGKPGQRDFRIIKFGKLEQRLPPPKKAIAPRERGLPTSTLWPIDNKNRLYAAELQWRIAMPLSVLLLAFLAVPLSQVRPRQGKYAKFLPAIVFYVFYANMLFVTRDWIRSGAISSTIGLWWLHGSVFMLALIYYLSPHFKKLKRYIRSSS